MEKIYLDNCAFNRPYDDQTILRIHLETQAKLQIQKETLTGKYSLVWSFILEYENKANPFEFKSNAIQEWKEVAKENVIMNEEIIKIANKLKKEGLRTKDALHIACAAYANVDYFITTDKKLLNKDMDIVKIISPVEYISQKGGDE